VADYIFDEMMDESLLDNKDVVQLMHAFREKYQSDPGTAISSFFIYHPDQRISSFAVSLLNFPYDESDHWRKEYSQSTGYSLQLFEQSYEDFMQTIAKDNDSRLMKYLKMDEDKTNEAVESAINYLKLKKIRRMLLENQQDMEKEHSPEEYNVLRQTHEHLKEMEIALAGRIGTVIIK
ncbi:MAG TPA: DNA primase, partial [Chitinophagaceae bacterium]|nr:DNA primase [Chitinophagaceae bacterium]